MTTTSELPSEMYICHDCQQSEVLTLHLFVVVDSYPNSIIIMQLCVSSTAKHIAFDLDHLKEICHYLDV